MTLPNSVYRTSIESSSGTLEILHSLPGNPSTSITPVLFIHGANCSAVDYINFLVLLSKNAYPAYAVSLRGHGQSWCPSWTRMMFLTTQSDYADDIQTAFNYIREQHPDLPPPVLIGHSFGGGMAQHVLSSGLIKASGLILLVSASLSGGGSEIMKNWQEVEAPEGYPWPWSPRSQLETPDQVRKVFFSDETDDEVIERWLKECRTTVESARAGLSVLWRFGTAKNVLSSLDDDRSRRVLLISAEKDVLVKPEMVERNFAEYQLEAGSDAPAIILTNVRRSGHHLMMDVAWEQCGQAILDWLSYSTVLSSY